ncbi:MAG TPA: MBL fold metallo-hydrolase, partial [Acidimicrobiales bacterium]|nr:MBL fold metallo-hydrolase [Acidimicrobiales bacterium]
MKFEVTGTQQLQAWADNVMPPVEKVRPGLWSIPVPMPNSSLRYVLVYALELPDGVAIIDAGWNTEEAWDALTGGLGEAGYSITDVKAVLVTHIHPDHYGLAGRVREASGAWVALHPADAAALGPRYDSPEGLLASMRGFLAGCGVPVDDLEDLNMASMGVRQFVTQAHPDVLLEDGDRADLPGWDLRAVWTPGHSPGHLCFVEPDRRVLLSGDHVLPRISPNISIHTQQTANPLADFMDALVKVAALEVDEVLPAHEYRFRGLGDRVTQLLGHHEDRLREVEDILRRQPGSSAWEVTRHMTWSRSWEEIQGYMKRSALGEAMAHLVVLEARGRVR